MDLSYLLRHQRILPTILYIITIATCFQNLTSNRKTHSFCSNTILNNVLDENFLLNYLNPLNKTCYGGVDDIANNISLSANSSLYESTKKEEMPSFGEWKEKEKEKSKNGEIDIPATYIGSKVKGSKLINFASITCGAKIVHVNPEAQNPSFILFENKDQYMINPCKARKTITIELCEAIQIQSFELGNLELFASLPEKFEIYITERYPNKEWILLGNFHARDERSVQTFQIDDSTNIFSKYLKIDFLSHYGHEHFCPITILRVFGLTMDEDDEIDMHEIYDEESLTNQPQPSDLPNLFTSAKTTVIGMVNNVLASTKLNNDKIINDSSDKDKIIRDSLDRDRIINYSLHDDAIKPGVNKATYKETDKNLTILSNESAINNDFNPQLPYPIIIDRTFKDVNNGRLNFFSLWRFRCNVNDHKYQCYTICRYFHLIDNNFIFFTNSIYLSNDNATAAEINEKIIVDSTISNLNNGTDNLVSNPIVSNIINEVVAAVEDKILKEMVKEKYEDGKPNVEHATIDVHEEIVNENLSAIVDGQFVILDSKKNIQPSNESKLEPFYDDSNLEEITYQKLSSRGKETIFLKLKNRIKSLEHNLNLTSRYLDELTQSLKRQIEEMNKKINESIYNYIVFSAEANERSLLQEEEIRMLKELASSLTETIKDTNQIQATIYKNVRNWHLLMIFFEVIVLIGSILLIKYRYVNPLLQPTLAVKSKMKFLNNINPKKNNVAHLNNGEAEFSDDDADDFDL